MSAIAYVYTSQGLLLITPCAPENGEFARLCRHHPNCYVTLTLSSDNSSCSPLPSPVAVMEQAIVDVDEEASLRGYAL